MRISGLDLTPLQSATSTELSKVTEAQRKVVERLSTGLRVNSASDDASSLAISEKNRMQIRGTAQAIRNTQSGISLLHVGGGGVTQLTGILKRMRDLAVYASNGELTSTDRGYVQTEASQLVNEVDRIANATKYNNQSLLVEGAFVPSPLVLTTGPTASQTNQTLVAETFTITYLGGVNFSVVGSVSGAHTNASAGTAYTSNAGASGKGAGLEFTVAAGAYTIGDVMNIAVSVNAGNPELASAIVHAGTIVTDEIKAVDIDNDNDVDILTLDKSNGDVTRRVNTGALTFAASFNYPKPTAIKFDAADMNNDGFVDIVSKQNAGKNLYVSLNDGAGGFGAAATTYGMATAANLTWGDIRLGDMNGDGWNDAVISSDGNNAVEVSINAAGALGAATQYTAAAGAGNMRALELGDIDGDNDLDVVATKINATGKVMVWKNNGGGGLLAPTVLNSGGDSSNGTSLVLTDVDGDSDLDIVTLNENSANIGVLKNNGAGVFAVANTYAVGVANANQIESLDLDGDGDRDIVCSTGASNVLQILTNDGTGVFALGNQVSSNGATVNALAVADFDRNGSLDIAAGNSGNNARIFSGSYTKTMTTSGPSALATFTFQVGPGTTSSDSISVSAVDASASNLGVSTVNMSTQAGAQTAITSIDSAMATLNSYQSTLGAMMSRFGQAGQQLVESHMQLSSADSRIRDADMAADVTEKLKLDIQNNVRTAAVAQMNFLVKNVLSILLGTEIR